MLNLSSFVLFLGLIFHQAWDSKCTENWTPSSKCSELTESGTISYDAHYEELLCWTILNPQNKLIKIEILELKFVAKDCVRNYFTIEKAGDDSVLKLCIDSDIPSYIASESNVEIKFRTEKRWNSYATCKVHFEIRDIRCSDENIFRCSNLSCISQFKVCDGVKDCKNGLDEKNCAHYNGDETMNSSCNAKDGKHLLCDCIAVPLESEDSEIDDIPDNYMHHEELNETFAYDQFNSSQELNTFRKKIKKPKISRKAGRAADAIIAAKKAAKIFYENEEKRAKERHMWEKARLEKEEAQNAEKHALETEILRTKVKSVENY